MAEQTEEVAILKVGTDDAVKSLADLRENIKELKKELENLDIGSEEYQSTLDQLKVNQNAVKDAMYATTSSFQDVAAAATGTAESYNGLVHRMAAMKEELRSTDISTEEGRKHFEELAAKINSVNDKLKELDALQGNYQRNVGNYPSAFKNWSESVDVLRKGLGATEGGLNGVHDAMEGISKSPMVASLGILVSVAMKLADAMGENENAMNAVHKSMDAVRPVMDFLGGVLEKVADFLADIITKVTEFVSSNGLAKKVVSAVMGVGNAIFQYITAPLRGIVAAIKVFKEQGIAGFKDAAKALAGEVKNGFSFRQNFEAGQAIGDALIAGGKSKKEEAKEEAKAAAKEVSQEFKDSFDIDGLIEELDNAIDKVTAEWQKADEAINKAVNESADKRIKALEKITSRALELNSILTNDDEERAEKAYEIQLEGNQKQLALLEELKKAAYDRGDLDQALEYDQAAADLQVEIQMNAMKEQKRLRQKDLEDRKANGKSILEIYQALSGSVSSVLGDIADMYEKDSDNSEKSAKKVKTLRIASATIDTISGAIGAYMQAVQSIAPPWGIIVGAANAATVTAAGIAQIAKLKNTKIDKNAGDSGSAGASTMGAAVQAPTVSTEVANVRTVTSASEEDRLNQMASDQRVYILASDIEASQNARKTRVAESSF